MANTSKWKQAAEHALRKTQAVSDRVMAQFVCELEQFLRGEGVVAQQLLRASKRFIRLGEEREGGYAAVYIFDGEGLRVVTEPSGTWVVYAKSENLKSSSSPLSARQAIAMIAHHQRLPPGEATNWLREQLDAIADQILRT